MKLLFDQNVSPRLVNMLADLFPGSAHVEPLGMGQADDGVLWQFAEANGFTLVSKDEDFNLMSVARGAPPKVLWLRLGNCATTESRRPCGTRRRRLKRSVAIPMQGR